MGLNLEVVLIEYYEAVANTVLATCIVTIKMQYILPLLDYIMALGKIQIQHQLVTLWLKHVYNFV